MPRDATHVCRRQGKQYIRANTTDVKLYLFWRMHPMDLLQLSWDVSPCLLQVAISKFRNKVCVISCTGWSLYRVPLWHLWQTLLHFQDFQTVGLWKYLTGSQQGVILLCSSATAGRLFNLVCASLSYNLLLLIHPEAELVMCIFTGLFSLYCTSSFQHSDLPPKHVPDEQ